MSRARICVSVCAHTAGEAAQRSEQAKSFGHLVELRLDCLDERELDALLRRAKTEPSFSRILQVDSETPFICTFRPSEQGGRRALTQEQRMEFWRQMLPALRSARSRGFADIELDLFEQSGAAQMLNDLRFEGVATEETKTVRVICSQHDFDGVPSDLENIYERMTRTSADILKVAVRADSILDCIPVFRLLERARREGREMIAVAMGEAGIVTRILGPSRGSYLTYAATRRESSTAPGQLTAGELHRLYRIETIDEATFITGLVGSPVGHSLSPRIHNEAFAARDLNGVYIPFEVEDVGEFVRRMAHPRTREMDWNLRGLSVTAPHKTEVMKHLDWIEPKAFEIGAVNTLVVEGDALRGYNTDADAALKSLRGIIELRGARVAVLGAGGAARSLLWGLRREGALTTLFARDVKRASATAKDFEAHAATLDGARFDDFDVVVNATPLGTRGRNEQASAAIAAQLRGARVVYDLVYNPSETRLMREGRAAGCEVVGGLPMLVAQAAEQFRLWTDSSAPIESMREAAQKRMAEIEGASAS